MSANERQVAGSHYNGGKLQHWDYAIQALHNRYLEGQITKYVMRHRKKNGLQDLQKAEHFLDKLIEVHVIGLVGGLVNVDTAFPMAELISLNGLNSFEAFVVKRMAHWWRVDHLEQVRVHIRALISVQEEHDAFRQAVKAGAAEPGAGYTNQD